MRPLSKKTVFWWNIPCAGMINVLKSYCETCDQESIVVTGCLSASRKAMGWADKGKLFPNHIIISDEDWATTSKSLIDKYPDRLHIFNGITHPARMKELIHYAISNNVAFCNMSEAYFNLENGMRKLAKNAYIRLLLPRHTRSIASKSLGVMCLSGNSQRDFKQFQRLGFKPDDIYPYGYFTDEGKEVHYVKSADGLIHLLCPGLLEHYKGVDVLIKAFKKLSDQGIDNFICHITGKGQMETRLKTMTQRQGLSNLVRFEGVLTAAEYGKLIPQIDILVAPGRVEPWGIRINEAIQRGQAVVISDGLGAASLIKDSNGGAIFPSGDSNALAECLIPLLKNPEYLAAAKQNNLEYKNAISCDRQAVILHKHISEILKKHPLCQR